MNKKSGEEKPDSRVRSPIHSMWAGEFDGAGEPGWPQSCCRARGRREPRREVASVEDLWFEEFQLYTADILLREINVFRRRRESVAPVLTWWRQTAGRHAMARCLVLASVVGRPYTVGEIAELVGLHTSSVRTTLYEAHELGYLECVLEANIMRFSATNQLHAYYCKYALENMYNGDPARRAKSLQDLMTLSEMAQKLAGGPTLLRQDRLLTLVIQRLGRIFKGKEQQDDTTCK